MSQKEYIFIKFHINIGIEDTYIESNKIKQFNMKRYEVTLSIIQEKLLLKCFRLVGWFIH